jgi:1-acyl-sn-glycerol-3-phosphate acyltransferase
MMSSSYIVPLHTRILREIARRFFRWLFLLLSQVHLTGKENIPETGPYLIAINHISLYEPPLVMAFWTSSPEAVGASDIWQRRGQAALARLYGGIPVHRGEYDRKVLDKMIAALDSGRPLLIAPEGGRTHTPGLRRGYPGVAYVVEKTRVPVVPVGVVGSTDDFFNRAILLKRPRVEIRIGKPIHLPPIEGKGEARRASRQRNVDLIMARIAALLPEDYRGVYADHPILKTQTAQ